ncbi:hypothetical protein SISSUDRAFT_1022938 [Sistotremastrum suecicum HHB10207 ss-3]|uniref:Uncharacterized protein n=1 Tax=Sistotremastrum suecicum HHB10207 ss-3 TaxID=1314776 RepID=A0A166CGA8_9AGAM|nr:hypothetical protein SISSUDRAFT_1022938 [Sistotremastrum suecicum HHB10207 ss-3]
MPESASNAGASDTGPYEPKKAVASAVTMGLYSGGVGLFISTIQNALGSHNRGALGVFTRTGGTIGFFAVMGATFALSEAVVGNLRSKNDALNAAAGGCAAGLVAGARARSVPLGLGSCLAIGALMGAFDATGSTLASGRPLESPQSVEERRRRFFKQKPTQPSSIEAD